MKLLSVVLLAAFAISNALPAPDADTTLSTRDGDATKAKYSCTILLYDEINWVGRHKVFDFDFEERVTQQCVYVGEDFEKKIRSIEVRGDRDCDCMLHEKICNDQVAAKLWSVRKPGLRDLTTTIVNNKTSWMSCFIH